MTNNISTKSVLKGYFQTGDKPTQSQFDDLISTLISMGTDTVVTVSSTADYDLETNDANSKGPGKTYVFTNNTSNFFVKSSKEGKIQINKENSYVVQLNETRADIYLEIENTGVTTVILDTFYADTLENELEVDTYMEQQRGEI